MTKQQIYSKLSDAISKGVLESVFENNEFLLFCFIKKYYMGFMCEDTSPDELVGILLTPYEAESIMRFSSLKVIHFLKKSGNTVAFTDAMIASLKTYFGRKNIKKLYKKKYILPWKTKKDDNVFDDSILENKGDYDELALTCVKENLKIRKELVESIRDLSKKVIKLTLIACVAICMIIASMLVDRESLQRETPAEMFDKHSEVYKYSYIDCDFITPLAGMFDANYYLFANKKDGTYGVLKLANLYEKNEIGIDDDNTCYFDEQIRLYGITNTMPVELKMVKFTEELSVQQRWESSNELITLPDGTQIPKVKSEYPYVNMEIKPPNIVKDFGIEVGKLLEDHNLLNGSDVDLGDVHIVASTEPHQENTFIIKLLNGVSLICSIIFVLFFFVTLAFYAPKEKALHEMLLKVSSKEFLLEQLDETLNS